MGINLKKENLENVEWKTNLSVNCVENLILDGKCGMIMILIRRQIRV